MSIKVVYNKFSDVCKHYTFGKKLLDEPEKIIDRLDEHFDYEKFGRDVRLEEGGSFVDKGYFVSR